MSINNKNRKSISKGIRFDVFKRDSFKCQYCGAESPGVLLQVDHIVPVSKGGTYDFKNLVTSCQPCNSGKSDKLLNDNTCLTKSRLQERREQLDMFTSWKQSLGEIAKDAFWKSLNRRTWAWKRTRRIQWIFPLIMNIKRLVGSRRKSRVKKTSRLD